MPTPAPVLELAAPLDPAASSPPVTKAPLIQTLYVCFCLLCVFSARALAPPQDYVPRYLFIDFGCCYLILFIASRKDVNDFQWAHFLCFPAVL
ncbi:hypothetical protein B0H19DRAFT_1244202, partial [Mycena capillaripes]